MHDAYLLVISEVLFFKFVVLANIFCDPAGPEIRSGFSGIRAPKEG
jgi:hypothetical protein